MSQSICQCHCGTRIDLDEQLLQQRQMWKQKYLCLQKQFQVDVQTLKDNIYAECSAIMVIGIFMQQQEFLNKENEHNRFVNQKNVEVKDLIAKIIGLETQVKVLSKEKELTEYHMREIEREIESRDETIMNLKNRACGEIRNWEQRHSKQIIETRERLTHEAKQNIEKVEAERETLKQKLRQFEVKYQRMLPQIQKIKNALQTKTAENNEFRELIEKLKKKQQQESQISFQKIQDLNIVHSTCSKQIKDLITQNEQLMKEVDKCRKISRDVRVEPVYIDRPVEVERVIEKIVQVERIVNKIVESPNNDKRTKCLEEDNQKLREELNSLLRQIKQIEENFQRAIHDLEENIKDHEKNAGLYKSERESLALRLNEQNKQIELLHNFVERLGVNRVHKPQNDNEKIIVHVKQDGTYQKTVERWPASVVAPIRKKK